MFTESDVQKAVDFLRDNAVPAAEARAVRIYLEEWRKSLQAQLQTEVPNESLGAQVRYAHSHERYLKHLDALKHAVFEDSRNSFLREAAKAKVQAWQTESANNRGPL
jgi:hypothetical protein